ncbi:MFS general substrate transporter [Pleomassaria siparia CBS 279.74]|uniref:MFS general substrate transporter n=1 Tax=Pleomassaria siparia CBS 279.74 TaxID=1314801 RepID=A0A6G1KBH4_9PLEO|nr:MFS general substrate transporter [Pleomassaria siparia CBS 279.74]
MAEKIVPETTSKSSIEEYGEATAQPSNYLAKLDLRLIPILGVTYTILFLDRTNIANARIEGLEAGLNMPSNGYATCLWIFYIPFVLVEVPSNMIMSLPRVRPNIFLGINMLILGVLSTCQGLTASYGGMLALRFLIGIFEATLPAGAAYLICEYYTRKEASLRFAMFFTFGVLGPCISGLLAYGIRNMNGIQGKEGWRWIFILEGIFTIIMSFLVCILVPDFPERTTILSSAEKAHLLAKLRADKGDQKLSIKSVNWLLACWVSGRVGWRFPFVLMGILIVMCGWIIQIAYSEKLAVAIGLRYFSLFLMSAGTFLQMAMTTAWMTNNLRGRASIAVGTAMILGLGNCANFIASNVFFTTERPYYPTGFRTGLGITMAGAIICITYVGVLVVHNKKLDKKRREGKASEDDQVEYRYQY